MEGVTLTELCKILQKNGSDKAVHHSYSPEYHNLLKDKRKSATHVLEIGIGTNALMKPIVKNYKIGASLYGWMKYFENATIIGIDIESIFQHDRIHCFYCDQSSEESLASFIEKTNLSYDLIIDDGSHILDHQLTSLKMLLPHLKDDGIYIIEDIPIGNIDRILSAVNPDQVLKVHKGKWSGDNFVAIKK